ncbi:MAG: Radical domain protein [Peptococcaceae bacterium]|jgi:putative DNA modification/repair radical SAM protein|nr:Radical domain protein [Peptococcaceae bacterium]
MDIDKLALLGAAAKYDICASTSSGVSKVKNPLMGSPVASGICHSFTPDGRCVSLLKVLMTNECQKDCSYCANRVQRDIERTSFTAPELSKIFIELYRRNYVEGLFLSSGIKQSTTQSMEEMIKTAEILREKYRFGGYIHLKILPGSSPDLIAQAVKLANRVSLNLEVPNENRLQAISKTKNYHKELLTPLKAIAADLPYNPGTTQTTQFIVGAAQESDQEILTTVMSLYKDYRVKRSYFSAFQPVPQTPLENLKPVPLKRENRLYQAEFLFRLYKFTLDDLVFDPTGNLDLTLDPKLMFAVKNPQLFPMEINRASFYDLLRVPGIGPKSARRLLVVRRRHRFTSLEELKNVGVVIKRASPFITINGKKQGDLNWLYNPQPQKFTQLSFW